MLIGTYNFHSSIMLFEYNGDFKLIINTAAGWHGYKSYHELLPLREWLPDLKSNTTYIEETYNLATLRTWLPTAWMIYSQIY